MPSLRSIPSNAPRSPLARQTSASSTIRNFSAALNPRLVRRAFVSTVAPLEPSARKWRSLSTAFSGSRTTDGFGKVSGPFSAHRHLRFQRELSHPTLAQGGLQLALPFHRLVSQIHRIISTKRWQYNSAPGP